MAAAEIGHHCRLSERLAEHGADPSEAMAPFVRALDAFHEGTRPSTWLEGLVKAYVGDGLATDFYREIAVFLDRKSTRLNSSHANISYAVFCLKKKTTTVRTNN